MTGPIDEAQQRRIDNLRAVYGHLRGEAPPAPAAPAAPVAPTAVAPGRASAPSTQSHSARRRGLWGTIIAVVLIVLSKLKFLGILASVFKLKTLGTMALTIAAYASQSGVWFAVGFVLLIFVHEMGHVIQLRREGIPASAPVFIPFVGAFVAMRGLPRNAYVEAKVGIAGPILGTLGAWAVLGVGLALDVPVLLAVGHVGLLLNLFNLLPVSPLDGGRVAGAFPKPFWIVGYAVGLAALVLTRSPLLLIVMLVGLWTLWQRWRAPVPGYYDLTPSQRWGMAAAYAGLVAAILATMPL